MAVRTINKGTAQLALTNLTPQRIAVLNGVLPKSGSTNVPLEDYVNVPGAAEDLAGLVEGGQITVSLNGVNMTAADLRSMRTLENPVALAWPFFADATRPAATDVPVGYTFFNTDDNALNMSDGTNWIDLATALAT